MQNMLSKYNQDTFCTARHFRELQKDYIVKKKTSTESLFEGN